MVEFTDSIHEFPTCIIIKNSSLHSAWHAVASKSLGRNGTVSCPNAYQSVKYLSKKYFHKDSKMITDIDQIASPATPPAATKYLEYNHIPLMI